ncbi:MAG: hypothetical protein ABW128_20765 [Rhizorhabdus sp.]
MKIGFLFNHDQVHQVAHSLPIALALADADTGAQIVLAVTSDRLRAEVVRHAGAAISRGALTLVQLGLRRRASRAIARLGEGIAPATKLLIYRDNIDFFAGLDVLVVAEKTSLLLRTRYGLNRLKIIHTRHGAGDRAIGFDPASAGFDHVLVSGTKIRNRLVADAGVDPARISIVGYPKFDIAADRGAINATIGDDRPVVLYNPHVSPHLSSWFRLGRQVLDWFVDHDEYQLIFAPHVMLFERSFVVTVDKMRIDRCGRIEERYLRAPNIHIDLGSRASTTMAYTNRADIYLGDVSSQVYEFLVRPRPCIFLDAHRTDWMGDANYGHWNTGRVVGGVAGMAAALETAAADHADRYRAVQERLFADSFDLTAVPSSVRAAAAVAQVAGLPMPQVATPDMARAVNG